MDCMKCGLTLTAVDTEVYECHNVNCEDYLGGKSPMKIHEALHDSVKYVLGVSGTLAFMGLWIINQGMSIVSLFLSSFYLDEIYYWEVVK